MLLKFKAVHLVGGGKRWKTDGKPTGRVAHLRCRASCPSQNEASL